ncbi:hypothetical protein ACVGXP_00070, partial [Enterobacter hormaechei]
PPPPPPPPPPILQAQDRIPHQRQRLVGADLCIRDRSGTGRDFAPEWLDGWCETKSVCGGY